ncbi:Sensor protein FixL [Corynebacterium occultum]|uniref:Sensor protein FixL n=1 Tax=Corynebacterium occultum TaxID=2675219 RepID=A0A6B8VRQ5_9CORY|nr:PAS domain-containing protein [Corynebacterium occultum]QGU06803.1 Sensor protein FixL [Corynebacterium occultum]
MSTERFNELAARIVEETSDAVVLADREGRILLWNSGAEKMFGHKAEDARGQSLDIIIPQKHRRAHWTGWERVIESGETRYGSEPLSVPGMRADGSRVALEFSITMFKDSEGSIRSIAAIMRDVGVKWEQTQEMRRELRELKARLQS